MSEERGARENDKYVGACWLRESKNGNTYLSGIIELDKLARLTPGKPKVRVGIFENTKKQSEKSPDYRILFFPDNP